MIVKLGRAVRNKLRNAGFSGLVTALKAKRGWILPSLWGWSDHLIFKRNPAYAALPAIDLNKIGAEIKSVGLKLKDHVVDVDHFLSWLNAEKLPESYLQSQGEARQEKALEHFLSKEFLSFTSDDVYLDIAAHNSPWAKVVQEEFGCQACYAIDLKFPFEKLEPYMLQADATCLPFTDGSVSKVSLHCAFEMFEGDSDIALVREIARVLRVGGRMVILPLYLNHRDLFWANPVADHNSIMKTDLPRHWRTDTPQSLPGVAFSREYSPTTFYQRIVKCTENFEVTIYQVNNVQKLGPNCYCNFVAVFERK